MNTQHFATTIQWHAPNMRQGRDAVVPIITILMTAILAYLPYAEALADVSKIQLFGYSAWVSVVPAGVILVAFTILVSRRPRVGSFALLTTVAVSIVLYLRVVWGISDTESVLLSDFAAVRFLVLLPVYLALFAVACETAWFQCWAPRVVILNGMIAALFGILYSRGVVLYKVLGVDHNVRAISEAGLRTRASGLFAGSNMYAHFLAIIVVLSLATRWKLPVKISFCVVLFGGILASESRAALAEALIAVFWSTWRKGLPLATRIGRFLMLAAVLVFIAQYSETATESVSLRMTDNVLDRDFQNRMEKVAVGLNATFSSFGTTLLGARTNDLVLGVVEFSDNGFVAMLTRVGAPLSAVFLWGVWQLVRQNKKRWRSPASGAFWFVTLTTTLFNNAIYWDSWLFHMAMICVWLESKDVMGPVLKPWAGNQHFVPVRGDHKVIQSYGLTRQLH